MYIEDHTTVTSVESAWVSALVIYLKYKYIDIYCKCLGRAEEKGDSHRCRCFV